MIKPSIGRIVWYHPQPDEHCYSPRQVLAALVTAVHSDTCVNLAVFAANGSGPHARESVYLLQDDALVPGDSYAEWMPFQKGQAAKTEQLQQTIAPAGIQENFGNGQPNQPGIQPAALQPPSTPYPQPQPVDVTGTAQPDVSSAPSGPAPAPTEIPEAEKPAEG